MLINKMQKMDKQSLKSPLPKSLPGALRIPPGWTQKRMGRIQNMFVLSTKILVGAPVSRSEFRTLARFHCTGAGRNRFLHFKDLCVFYVWLSIPPWYGADRLGERCQQNIHIVTAPKRTRNISRKLAQMPSRCTQDGVQRSQYDTRSYQDPRREMQIRWLHAQIQNPKP